MSGQGIQCARGLRQRARPAVIQNAPVLRVAARALTLLVMAMAVSPPGIAAARDLRAPVVAMYRNFAWEALSSDTDLFGPSLVNQSARTLSAYFEPRLAKMIAEDSACQERTQAFCKLDFDLLFDSQDPPLVDLRIAAGPSNTVEVRFTDPVTQKETLIVYSIARQSNTWRITDASYRGRRSLRTLLSAPARAGGKAVAK